MVLDQNNALEDISRDFDIWVSVLKNRMGAAMESVIKNDVFNKEGPATQNTDPLNPGGVNEVWKPLSNVTILLKKSTRIMKDTMELFNLIRWTVEDSTFDDKKDVVKLGWFEESGDRVWIAAVHEFGLTGQLFRTPEGLIMGGPPIGRTPQARKNIRNWYRKRLGMNVSGTIIIPSRSMLRKTADMIDPMLEELADASFLSWLSSI